MKNIFSIIVAVSIFAGIMAVLNLGLHYGQEFWHKEDQQRLDLIKKDLELSEGKLARLERSIKASDFSNERQIDNYNELADAYNAKIKEANTLSENIGSKYYIIPRGKGRGLR
jgi:hypothetical protein